MNTKLFRYGLISGVSYALNVALTSGLSEVIGVAPATSFAISLVVVTLYNFWMCRTFIFRSASPDVGGQLRAYVATTIVSRSLEYVGFLALNVRLGVHYVVALTIVTGLAVIGKFLWYNFVVFAEGRSHESQVEGDLLHAETLRPAVQPASVVELRQQPGVER